MIVGLSVALLKEKNYEYTSVITIGEIERYTNEGTQIKLIETAENAKSKLENAYLPQIIHDIKEKEPDINLPDVKISIPKNSQLLLLKAKAKKDDPYAIKIQSQLTEALIQEHLSKINKILLILIHNLTR